MTYIECHDCGYGYCPDIPAERSRHRRLHDAYVNGVAWADTDREEVIGLHERFRIVHIGNIDPTFLQKRAVAVGRRANAELRFDFGVYHPGEIGVTALVAVKERRGVGILVLQPMTNAKRFRWVYLEEVHSVGELEPKLTLGCGVLWVHPGHRRQGIARAMVMAAMKAAEISDVADFPWLTPFSADGRRLIRGLTPEAVTIGC